MELARGNGLNNQIHLDYLVCDIGLDDANDTGHGYFGSSFLSKSEPSNQRQPARLMLCAEAVVGLSRRTCYLVDLASSHMLISNIKPCICKYELI